MLKVGIIGLPNVGKSTLFNALLKRQVAESANYPFTTIEPNIGVVEVPDPRLEALAKMIREDQGRSGNIREDGSVTIPDTPSYSFSSLLKVVPATVQFIDIAGLVKDAHKGEGLGNRFLSHIREVDAITHVVRVFEDPSVIRAQGPDHQAQSLVDPKSDIETVNTELILADLETIQKLIETVEKELKIKNEKLKIAEQKLNALREVKGGLEKGILAKDVPLTREENEVLGPLPLITIKPTIYVFNAAESDLNSELRMQNSEFDNFTPSVVICAKVEAELAELDEKEQEEYLKELGLAESGLERLIRESYQLLGLITFFTAGEKSSSARASERQWEVRAWTVRAGETALGASGLIHSDIQKGFIKAEVINWEKLVAGGGWNAAREKGLVRLEGRDYIVQDGDVVLFKFNV